MVTEQKIRIKKHREFSEQGLFFTALVLNNVGGITLSYRSRPELMYRGTDSLPAEFDAQTGIVRRTFKPASYFIVEDILDGDDVLCEQKGGRLKVSMEGACRIGISNNMVLQRFECINAYSDIVPIIKMHHTDSFVIEPGDTFDLKFSLTCVDNSGIPVRRIES